METIIHTPTNRLEDSLDFYKRLNFEVVSGKNPTLVSDGMTLVEINPDRFARAGVKLYKDSWTDEVKEAERQTTVHKLENGYMLSDLNGVWIYLIEGRSGIGYKTGEEAFGITGKFVGLSIEAADMPKSAAIWTTAGFTISSGTPGKSSWVSLTNENGLLVNLIKPLSCPHLFFNPSMTYFNGKNNLAVIQKIREAGIPIAEEITHFNKEGIVDNIIIRDPGGYGFFIYND